MVPIWEQFQWFFFTIAIGLLLGVLVDGYRGFYRFLRPRSIMIGIGDLLLWFVLTGLVFFLLLLNNWGEVRAYVIAGMIIGILIYQKLFSRFILGLWVSIFSGMRKVFFLVLKIIILPLKLLQRLLFIPLGLVSILLDWLWRVIKTLGRKVGIKPRTWRNSLHKWWYQKKK